MSVSPSVVLRRHGQMTGRGGHHSTVRRGQRDGGVHAEGHRAREDESGHTDGHALENCHGEYPLGAIRAHSGREPELQNQAAIMGALIAPPAPANGHRAHLSSRHYMAIQMFRQRSYA
jgi:hypothetical protein